MSEDRPITGAAEYPLLTADDVAELLQIPRATVYEYTRAWADPLPSMKIGKHVRFDHDSLRAWLDRRRRDAGRAEQLQAAQS